MKKLLPLLALIMTGNIVQAQFAVSADQRFLTKDGKPFFWLGDTAWELFHRLDREEADHYLKRRSQQGFTVIQATVLALEDGLHVPNPYGHVPLVNDDPTKPDENYFRHVDYIIDRAAFYNINLALFPTWGDKVNKQYYGMGPEIFNEKNIVPYTTWVVKRYLNRKNIIWVVGGDRNPRGPEDVAIWNAMGNAIMTATNNKALCTFHPQPNELGSAEWFHNEKWLAFNMFQNGHCRDEAIYDKIRATYNLTPAKPVLDGEPLYEDHPVCRVEKDLGTSTAYDMRKYAYLSIFAGAHGHTYGCHDIWQMHSPKLKNPFDNPHHYWYDALELPGALQMAFVKKLVETYPLTGRVPDQSIIRDSALCAAERMQATRGNDFVWVYSTMGKPITVIDTKIKSSALRAYWFDPRTGATTDAKIEHEGKNEKFTPPTTGYGQDWVLVIDDETKGYKRP